MSAPAEYVANTHAVRAALRSLYEAIEDVRGITGGRVVLRVHGEIDSGLHGHIDVGDVYGQLSVVYEPMAEREGAAR